MNQKLLLLPLPLMVGLGCAKQAAPERPNVIVIIADDLGYGDLSINGSKAISTPNIDRLGREGVHFTNGYATSSTSTPSRYGMFTGMYPWKNDRARILSGDAPLLIPTDVPTWPKMMQEAGYATAAIGKWHLGMGDGNVDWNQQITPSANTVGFDYTNLIAATNDRVPTVYVKNGIVEGLDPTDPISVSYKQNFEGEPTAITHPELMTTLTWHHGHNQSVVNGIPRIGYMQGGAKARWVDEDMADYFVSDVKHFLDDNKNKPFFLYYGLHQPHVPRAPHSRFVGSTTLGPRGDAVVEADWCVGELMAYLDELGLTENTLILFSSDNGHVLQDGYNDGADTMIGDHDPAAGRRGGKYSLFDGGTHVPFFAYWKGHIEPVVSDAMICQLDFFASIGDLIGAEVPAGLDSENHMDVLLGETTSGREELVVEANGKLAFRSGNYAMIPPYKGQRFNETGNELGNLKSFALFNLDADCTQTIDIATQEVEKLEQMKGRFMEITKGFYKTDVEEIELQ